MNNNTLEYQLSSPDYEILGVHGRNILNYRVKKVPKYRQEFLRSRRFFMALLKYCLNKHGRHAVMHAVHQYPIITQKENEKSGEVLSLKLYFKARIESDDNVCHFYLEFVPHRARDHVTTSIKTKEGKIRVCLIQTKRFNT